MRQDLNRSNVHWTFDPSASRMFVTAEVAGSRSIESIKKGPRLQGSVHKTVILKLSTVVNGLAQMQDALL